MPEINNWFLKMLGMQITTHHFYWCFLFRLYNLKDHRELGALMQHEGKNWCRFFAINCFRAEALITILTLSHVPTF